MTKKEEARVQKEFQDSLQKYNAAVTMWRNADIEERRFTIPNNLELSSFFLDRLKLARFALRAAVRAVRRHNSEYHEHTPENAIKLLASVPSTALNLMTTTGKIMLPEVGQAVAQSSDMSCRCLAVAADPRFSGLSMTFKCKEHGVVTIDKRVSFMQPPLYRAPAPAPTIWSSGPAWQAQALQNTNESPVTANLGLVTSLPEEP